MEQTAAATLLVRCPDCKMGFVCLPELLKAKAGWLRCGSCSEVFDGYKAIEEPLMRPSALKPVEAPAWAAEAKAADSLAPAALMEPATSPATAGASEQTAIPSPPRSLESVMEEASKVAWETPAGWGSRPEPLAEGVSRVQDAPLEEALEEPEDDIVAQLKQSLEQGARDLAEREALRQGVLSQAQPMGLAGAGGMESMGLADLERDTAEMAKKLFGDVGAEPAPESVEEPAARWDRARILMGEPEGEAPEFMRAPRKRPAAWVAAGVAVFSALLAQGVYSGRTGLAAAAPATRPALEWMCAQAGCEVGYEQREEKVSMQSADLKEILDGSKVEFRAVVASTAAGPVKAPGIRLEILDASGGVMSRRDFPAKTWLGREYLAPRQEAEARMRLEPLSEAAGNFKAVLIWPSVKG